MKKIFGLAVAIMLGLTIVGCEETIEDTNMDVTEDVKQEEQMAEVEKQEIKEEKAEVEEPKKEVENTVLTFENEEFKHYMTACLDGEEYDKYFNDFELKWNQDSTPREIEFDGFITAIFASEKYNTRSELCLAAGDYDGTDVNNYQGIAMKTDDIGNTELAGIQPGTNVKVRATIDEYDLMYTGQLHIHVIEITVR